VSITPYATIALMPELALALYVLYIGLAFGLRTVAQIRATGSSGFSGISGRPGSAEWTGGVLFVVALVLGLLGPVLDLAGVLDPIDALDGQIGHAAGIGLFWGGLVTTLGAQFAMGESWRIGVDESEQTEMVTSGPFSIVRNPIFTAMVPTAIGLALLVPNVASVAGAVALVVALQIQVRLVEEPYLLRAHGEAYAGYARRVGRFVPLLGRLR
jgi:protein-S-isoprenylcysteine O-methyltransferase Ste14